MAAGSGRNGRRKEAVARTGEAAAARRGLMVAGTSSGSSWNSRTEKYGPERVVDTVITEAGFSGVKVGIAFYGLRPVVDFMTFNFIMQAIEHIINSAVKMNCMSTGDISVSIVSRGAAARVDARLSQALRRCRNPNWRKLCRIQLHEITHHP
ncbi:pyruvate dehydrogenase E1 component subunit beta-2, mitochondrial-like [Eucalyptus grandis]|uniref:pyruvate dehydrogenase E1 component subunit beta-2, mitochondrial-like n=1 Tax=Eucalyptus grandis TaxID=71139 RepID=UPI00192EF09D|nr:pyruvate dehydrogenase E1 component subunit beta-2, mitochondrial-like [Eucalyptus grandis]